MVPGAFPFLAAAGVPQGGEESRRNLMKGGLHGFHHGEMELTLSQDGDCTLHES